MASILETFIILFKGDASNVKQGAAEAKKATDQLNSSLAATDKLSTSAGAGLTNLAKQYGGLVLSVLSVASAVKGITAAANYAEQLHYLSKALNVNIQDLSAWSDAVKKNGGTAEGFQATVRSMTNALAELKTKGISSVSPFFRMLGIETTDGRGNIRSFLDLLPELADAFGRIGHGASLDIGKRMGLDEGTILLLQKGRREVDTIIARQKELGVVTKQDAELAAKFNRQWEDTAHIFRSLYMTIGTTILPAFTAILKGVERVTSFLQKNSHLVTGAMIVIGGAILVFVVPPLLKAAAAALVLYAPFLLISAVVALLAAGFALLYDDIMHFMEGNNSVIGSILTKWPVVGDVIKTIIGFFNDLFAVAKIVFGFIGEGIDKIGNGFKAVKSFLGFGDNSEANIIAGQQALNIASTSPISSNVPDFRQFATNNTRSNNTQIGTITVNTQATDADGIAQVLGTSLETKLRQAQDSFADGVIA